MTESGPDPEDVLRAILAVSPEDAAEVRKIADVKAKPDAGRPVHLAKSPGAAVTRCGMIIAGVRNPHLRTTGNLDEVTCEACAG